MPIVRYRRTINRFELKYLLHHELASEFIYSLGEYIYPDSNGNGKLGYPIYSVYYDSPDLAMFWEKVEGIKFRRKVRFRRYGKGTEVFLEIKQRINQTVQKRRVLWPLDNVVRIFGSGYSDEGIEDKISHDPVTSEILYLWRLYGLQPTMAIAYKRQAFSAVYEPDLRITFDSHVQYHARDLDISKSFETGKYLVNPNVVIMEIKFNDCVPRWLCELIGRYNPMKVRISKYCTAVALEYFRNKQI